MEFGSACLVVESEVNTEAYAGKYHLGHYSGGRAGSLIDLEEVLLEMERRQVDADNRAVAELGRRSGDSCQNDDQRQ
jgi:hypothetical protein